MIYLKFKSSRDGSIQTIPVDSLLEVDGVPYRSSGDFEHMQRQIDHLAGQVETHDRLLGSIFTPQAAET